MGKRSITMAFSDEVFDVFDEMKVRRIVRSGLVEDLILAYRDNDYKIPIAAKTVPFEMDEEEAAEIRAELEADDER